MTWAIIAINAAIFLCQLFLPYGGADALHQRFGAHPVLIVHGLWPWNEDSLRIATTLFTSMFLHADIEHVALNMLFFHVFSRVVEWLMGSWRFAVFYVLSGLGAGLAHCLANPESMTPIIGASGAVAGVLGAHVLLLPWDRVRVSFRSRNGTLPAWGFTAFWLFLQFMISVESNSSVAWVAHIGGLAVGIALAPVFRRAGVPLLGRSEGDVEPSTPEEVKEEEERKAEAKRWHAKMDDAAATPGAAEPPPAPQGRARQLFKKTLLGVWVAGEPEPEEPPLPEVRLSRVWSAPIAVAAAAVLGWWWLGVASGADARVQSRALEWRAIGHLGASLNYDPERALVLYRDAAELGDPGVQFRYAQRLARGDAGAARRAEAWAWYRRAAEGGNPGAMRVYAAALIEGKDVPRDPAAAAGFVEALARLGYAWGEMMRGHLLENGLGVAADPKQAAAHYKVACYMPHYGSYGKEKSDGAPLACYRFSLLLLAKTVPSEKPDDAKTYMRHAADDGHDDARNAYGLWLATGRPDADEIGPDSTPDDAEARRYFSSAADAGHAEAMYNLARMLELKRPPYDGDQSGRIRALYEKSAAKGHAKAKAALERLAGSEPRKG